MKNSPLRSCSRASALLAMVLTLSGCVARLQPVVVRPYPPRPMGPAPRAAAPAMGYEEAVQLGYGYCQSRGYPCELQEAEATGQGVWHEKFKVRGDGIKGHLRLEFDAFSRRLLDVDEHLKRRGGGEEEEGEHDRGRHRGRGHGHGHDEAEGEDG